MRWWVLRWHQDEGRVWKETGLWGSSGEYSEEETESGLREEHESNRRENQKLNSADHCCGHKLTTFVFVWHLHVLILFMLPLLEMIPLYKLWPLILLRTSWSVPDKVAHDGYLHSHTCRHRNKPMASWIETAHHSHIHLKTVDCMQVYVTVAFRIWGWWPDHLMLTLKTSNCFLSKLMIHMLVYDVIGYCK